MTQQRAVQQSLISGVIAGGDRTEELGQYMTLPWVAEELIALDFADLSPADVVLDPTCGTGNFLNALPDNVPAFGVEIDPALADVARQRTGRHIIVGDFLDVQIEERPTAIIGNPPFSNDTIEAILNRCHALLPEGGRVGLIVPAALYSLPGRVMRLNDQFSFKQSLLPRYIYPRLSMPIVWSIFWKDTRRIMMGFALFGQFDAIDNMPPHYRARMASDERNPWRAIVEMALDQLGGEGTVAQIVEIAMPYCPETNNTPRDTVRRVCGTFFERVRRGRFRKAA